MHLDINVCKKVKTSCNLDERECYMLPPNHAVYSRGSLWFPMEKIKMNYGKKGLIKVNHWQQYMTIVSGNVR